MTGLTEIFTKTRGGLAAAEIISISWVITPSKIEVIKEKPFQLLVARTTKVSFFQIVLLTFLRSFSLTQKESQGDKTAWAKEDFMCTQRPGKLVEVESTEEPLAAQDILELRIARGWENGKDLHSYSPIISFDD